MQYSKVNELKSQIQRYANDLAIASPKRAELLLAEMAIAQERLATELTKGASAKTPQQIRREARVGNAASETVA